MRAILFVLLAFLLVPSVSAGPGVPKLVNHSVEAEGPTDECPDCFDVSASGGTAPPPGCMDCDAVGGGAGVSSDGDSTTTWVKVCKSGIVYFCPVDESVTV